MSDLIKNLHNLANMADDIALHYFGKASLAVEQKQDASPVSQADLEIEAMIRKTVPSLFPGIECYGEEFGQCDKTAPYKLIIDPIDGTRNFIRGLPWFATLLAIEQNGEIIAGLISSPATKDRWWAEKNGGAFMNSCTASEKKLSTSSILTWTESQFFHGSLFGSEAALTPESLLTVLSKSSRQRGVGDYLAHMLVAMGCGEAAIDFGLKAWDIGPIKIIVEEAGGKVTNSDGQFSLYTPSLISSNNFLHQDILTFLNK